MESAGSDAEDTAEPMDEVKEAASAVIGSLRRLLEATERLIADPVAFDQAVAGGRGLIEAFTSGFADESQHAGSAGDGPIAESDSESPADRRPA